jgi:PIN domain nuclease of toxin-antitoxin system
VMNHVLLDSHVLLWLVEPGTKRLSARAKRMVAQAITEPLHLLTSDEKLKPYNDLVILA